MTLSYISQHAFPRQPYLLPARRGPKKVRRMDNILNLVARQLRDLLAEAAEHRRQGDLAAALTLEVDAVLVLRTLPAQTTREVRA